MRRPFPPLSSLFLFLLFCAPAGYAQDGKLSPIDSVRHRLDTAKITEDKIDQFVELARMTMDRAKAEDYAGQSIELAQLSREPRLLALRNDLNAPDVAEKSGKPAGEGYQDDGTRLETELFDELPWITHGVVSHGGHGGDVLQAGDVSQGGVLPHAGPATVPVVKS